MLFDRKCDAGLRLLVFLGAFILLVHPFGSSEGITTVIAYSVWLSFPVSINMLMNTESASLNLSITKPEGGYSLGLVQNSQDLLRIKMAGILLITFACLFNVIKYPNYFDRHDRLKMTYTVNNQWVRGLFTTQPKAEAINDLLRASTKYMKPGDIVLAYDCMPLYHFMTETKSYVRNPCIWYYTSGLFKNELDKAQSNSQLLPVVVRQKINTIGSGSGWPEILPPGDYLQIPRNQKKNQYFNEFLSRYSYTKVWSSPYFEILIPRTN